MAQHQYIDKITEFSKKELKKILKSIENPLCLIGGWAVHLQVNQGFKESTGRDYIGSRDIDLGIHIEPDWNSKKIREMSIRKTIDKIKDLNYEKSRFGFLKRFHRETGEELRKEEAKEFPKHNIFNVYIDLIPDNTQLDNFEKAFGFRPPAEPLLQKVFNDTHNEYSQPLRKLSKWKIPNSIIIPKPEVLAAMKINSIPTRDKRHKKIKDIADLHSLLWYVDEYNETKGKVKKVTQSNNLKTLRKTDLNTKKASKLLRIDENLIKNSIKNLLR